MSNTLHSLVNSTISNMLFVSTSISLVFFGRIFFIVTTIFCLTFGCHSKVNQKAEKENIIDCDFKNVSNSYRLSTHGRMTLPFNFLKKESDILTLLNPILQHFHAMIIILGFFKT